MTFKLNSAFLHNKTGSRILAVNVKVSRDSVSTKPVGGQFRPKQYAVYQFYSPSKRNDTVAVECRCKMPGAGFHSIAYSSSALKCLPRIVATSTNNITGLRITKGRTWPHVQYSLPPEHGAWQSSVHLRAVIPVVANRGI
jgi:hypothetical protein